MKQYAVTALALLAVAAALVAFAVFAAWAPRWAWQVAIGIGFASFLTEQWRRRILPRAFLANDTRRAAVAAGLVLAVVATMGWASGVWAVVGFLAAIAVGDVRRRRRHGRAA